MSDYEENLDEIVKVYDFEFTLFRNPKYDWEIHFMNKDLGKSAKFRKDFETKRKAKNFLNDFYSPEKLVHVKYL